MTCEGGTARAAEATARATPGFTGAELANVVNEAVLLAARDDREVVRVEDLLAGAERTKNGVGVGQGAGAVLSGLRRLVDFSKSGGKNGGGGGGGDAPGGGRGWRTSARRARGRVWDSACPRRREGASIQPGGGGSELPSRRDV